MNATATVESVSDGLVPTGVPGLDEVLVGGYQESSLHLIEGAPGTGKTTLAMQFLLDGRSRGQRGLYIPLSETRAELIRNAATHGWSLEGLDIFELAPPELTLSARQ